jgi:hypothetical protein
MAPALVVLTGPLGAGKTTLAREVALAAERGVHLQMDQFWFAVVDPELRDALPEVGAACDARGIPLHYVVLQADVETCLRRANGRAPLEDLDGARRLHALFDGLDVPDRHLVDAIAPADDVAATVLTAFRDDRFVVR